MSVLARSPGDVLSSMHFDPGHFTASGFVTDATNSRMLVIHHRRLDRWLQPGGHVEPTDPTLLAAAVREVLEETGVAVVAPDEDGEAPGLFDVDIHRIPASSSGPRHLHHDLRFRFVADRATLAVGAEVVDARWVTLEELGALTRERSMLRPARRLLAGDQT
ncbi:MAG: NUDIX hydrolase [Acidimicrobiia bacterium]